MTVDSRPAFGVASGGSSDPSDGFIVPSWHSPIRLGNTVGTPLESLSLWAPGSSRDLGSSTYDGRMARPPLSQMRPARVLSTSKVGVVPISESTTIGGAYRSRKNDRAAGATRTLFHA